uniref:Reverse transcriptase domain-containing protein n=1 Tax=Tanacetum cinerariifolium TaxID=118510 RepID=A0A6L2JW22_TANCI|nr:reverse transcriptase domain-containing protein [Tanacetum cinerariifolium]
MAFEKPPTYPGLPPSVRGPTQQNIRVATKPRDKLDAAQMSQDVRRITYFCNTYAEGPSPTTLTFAVRNMAEKGRKMSQENLNGTTSDAALREYCDKHSGTSPTAPAFVVRNTAGKGREMSQENLNGTTSRPLSYRTMTTHSGPSPTAPTSAVRNTAGKGREMSQENLNGTTSDVALREYWTPNRRMDLRKRIRSKRVRNVSGSLKSSRTTTVAKILKVVTIVPAQEEQNLLLRNIITKEHPHAGQKHCQKEKIVQENTGSQGGILTLKSSKIIPIECATVLGPEGHPSIVNQAIKERIKKPADMTGVPRHIAEHRLREKQREQRRGLSSLLSFFYRSAQSVNKQDGCPLISQKKRGQAADRNQAIQEKVGKLVDADFKDLNKACPKDDYPLSEIDWKVESLYGFPFKCFLDAYKGYHQIKMAKEDEEKTTFIASHEIFCYSKMPFGLRNVGATYQRLVEKAFHKQIGRNLEVYVDDIVIKIQEGMFLGYKVNTKGIKVCSDKADAILSLPSSKCLKDVQKLNGKLASLNRAGLILTNPKGTEFTYALRFKFETTNNEAEYKALIAGLRIAEQIVVEEEGDTWMTPIYEYLTVETLLAEVNKARAVRRSCSMHAGTRSVVAKALQTRYYWPTMHKDERTLIRECQECQVHRPVLRNPQQKLTPTTSPWSFYKWGINIAGPFSKGPSKVKFLIVAIDCFTKWIKAKPLATITGNQVKKFVWDNIVCIFGLPREIISDNGKQFQGNPFKDWYENLCIRQRFAFVKHPQVNGLVEMANQSLGEGSKARLDARSKNWMEEISHVLWAHRTMIKSSNGDTRFSLTYETEAVVPTEIGMPTLMIAEVDMVQNDEALKINLDLLEERREHATIREARSKAKMEKYYNSKVRSTSFKPGDLVYRSNDASHAEEGGKLIPSGKDHTK